MLESKNLKIYTLILKYKMMYNNHTFAFYPLFPLKVPVFTFKDPKTYESLKCEKVSENPRLCLLSSPWGGVK